jgi:hypothetical protein
VVILEVMLKVVLRNVLHLATEKRCIARKEIRPFVKWKTYAAMNDSSVTSNSIRQGRIYSYEVFSPEYLYKDLS